MQINDILNSLNIISEKLFKSVEGQVYIVLDKIVNIKPDILNEEPLKSIFLEGKLNGVIVVANSFILFYITYYVFTQLMSMYNGKKAENAYLFVMKIIVVFVLVNNSYFICSMFLEVLDAFNNAILQLGESVAKQAVSFERLKESILSIDDFMKNDLLSLNGLIKGVISFGIITILINFSIRYVTIIFLIIISPFAIMSISGAISLGFFKTWLRMFITNMSIQIVVNLLLIIPLVYKETGDLMYKIILVGTIYLMYKITEFTRELFVKISEDRDHKNLFQSK